MEGLLAIRYPPYRGKAAKFKAMTELKPNFDRDGNVKAGILTWILTLGAGTRNGALKRYILVALCESCPLQDAPHFKLSILICL
jgi:beta-apo-4'-carotenal oxygenase